MTFIGLTTDGKNITNQTSFIIDTKDPQISTTKPQSKKYTNGSDFYIKYTEDNCHTINLLINSQDVLSNPCNSGRNVEKYLTQNLSSFDGQEISYKFKITDIANNTDESRPVKVFVDTTKPVIKEINFNPTRPISTSIYLNVSIIESNLDKVEFLDSSDKNPRWNTLCSRLNKNNECISSKKFRVGIESIKIKVTDKAGNTAIDEVSTLV